MAKNKVNPAYYEKTDFSKQLQESKKKRVVHPKTRRITMNISELVYENAHELDKYLNMGYQNVLKAAIMVGLNDLEEQLPNLKKSA